MKKPEVKTVPAGWSDEKIKKLIVTYQRCIQFYEGQISTLQAALKAKRGQA